MFFRKSKRNVGENQTKIPPTAARQTDRSNFTFSIKTAQQTAIVLDPNSAAARRWFSLWYDGASSLRYTKLTHNEHADMISHPRRIDVTIAAPVVEQPSSRKQSARPSRVDDTPFARTATKSRIDANAITLPTTLDPQAQKYDAVETNVKKDANRRRTTSRRRIDCNDPQQSEAGSGDFARMKKSFNHTAAGTKGTKNAAKCAIDVFMRIESPEDNNTRPIDARA
jgi:hypothetical protein